MYNNKINVPSWLFLFSVIVSDVSDLNKSFPSCPWASPSSWLYVEVINLLSWEQLWHHRWSINFTTGQNKWMWWPVRRENLCLKQKPSLSESWPGAWYPQSLQRDPSLMLEAQNKHCLVAETLSWKWWSLWTGHNTEERKHYQLGFKIG